MYSKTKILAVDPGQTCGYVEIIKGQDYFINESGNVPPEDIIDMVSHNDYDIVLMEDIESYGMPVGKDVFRTLKYMGRIEQQCVNRNIEIKYIKRSEIKLAICRRVSAKDTNIRQALIDEYGGKGTKKNKGYFYGVKRHAWNAFAVFEAWKRKYVLKII